MTITGDNGMSESTKKQEFLLHLPWYVNGTLETDKRQFIDGYLKEHPDDIKELYWHRELCYTLQNPNVQFSAEKGWQGCLKKIQSEQPKLTLFKNLGLKIIKLIEVVFVQHRPALTFTLAAAALVELGFIGHLAIDQQSVIKENKSLAMKNHSLESMTSRYKSFDAILSRPIIEVKFKANTSEFDMRMLLVNAFATVVEGPSQLGVYKISVPDDRLDSSMEKLSNSSIIEFKNIVSRGN